MPNASAASPPAKTPTEGSHAAWLASEIERLETLLRPATRRQAAAAIGVVMSAYGRLAGDQEDKPLAELYLAAAAECPADILKALAEDITFGRVEEVSLDYPPKVPRFAKLCRDRTAARNSELCCRRDELERLQLPPPVSEPSPAERQRVAGLMSDLADRMRGSGARPAERPEGQKSAKDEARARAGRIAADLERRRDNIDG